MIRVGVHGALGRMGSMVIRNLADVSELALRGAFERPKHPDLGKPLQELLDLSFKTDLVLREPTEKAYRSMDVVIDFTEPQATQRCAELAEKAGCRLVIGTTGLEESHRRAIRRASRKVAVVCSPNMSVGANLLFDLAEEAALRLDPLYDIEIIEAHHRDKKDAPSGTAQRLAERIAKAKQWDLRKAACYGRKGPLEKRPRNQIGIHVIRAGDIVGDHTALFSGPGERVLISHVVTSREPFARGALLAARFAAHQKKGLYDMGDVLRWASRSRSKKS